MATDRPLIFVKLFTEGGLKWTNTNPGAVPAKPYDVPLPPSKPYDVPLPPPKLVRLKGTALDISDKILSLRYEDEERKADKLSLTLDNHTLEEFDNPAWKKGGILEVSWGYPGNMTPPRRVVIEKVKGSRELTVEAHGLEMLMNKVKQTKVYEGKTLHQLAEEVFKQFEGLIADQQTVDSANPSKISDGISVHAKQIKIVRATQSAQTAAQFISKYARKYGYVFYLDHKGFRFEPRDEVYKRPPAKTITWFNGNGEWLSFDYENEAKDKSSKIKHKLVDPENKKERDVEASNDKTKRNGLGARLHEWTKQTAEIVLKTTEVAPEAFKVSRQLAANSLKKSGEAKGGRTEGEEVAAASSTDVDTAKHAVDGKYKKQHSAAHKLSGTVIGDPSFLAKSILQVEGIGRRLSGRWAVKSVEHKIDRSGYICDFKSERDADNGYGERGEADSKAAVTKEDKKKKTNDPVFDWNHKSGEISRTGRDPTGRGQ